jgi:hypothetical protein
MSKAEALKSLVLPTEPTPATMTSPKRLVLFSKPKTGKTTIVSKLPKNLVLDFEKGTRAVTAMKLEVTSYAMIDQICQAIVDAKKPYYFITVDTSSSLEELCLQQAEILYANSPDGEKWFLQDEHGNLHRQSGKMIYQSILNLPFGKGYNLLEVAYELVLRKLEACCSRLIILAHSTTTVATNESGNEVSSLDLQMQKKTKFVTLFKADACGYLYRKGKQNWINFTPSGDVAAGGRLRHLEKEHMLISEYDADDNLITYWDKIYPEIAPKKK